MIAVVLPAYNEEDTIVPLVEGIQRIGKKRLLEEVIVIVVENGSRDGTAQQVESLSNKNVILVRHGENKDWEKPSAQGYCFARSLQRC